MEIDYKTVIELEKQSSFLYKHKENFPLMKGMSFEDIFHLLLHMEIEKNDRNKLTDSIIEYDDEIVEIIEYGLEECMDITVTGDNLFFANGILTKNSIGLPATLDLFLAITQTEELKESSKYLFKQLKNRLGDPAMNTRFIVGVDKPKMRLFDVEQGDVINDTPVMDKGRDFVGIKKPDQDKSKFAKFK